MRKVFKWLLVAVIVLVLLTLPSGSRSFNPAQREGAPYLYNITLWELNNVFDKWLFRAANAFRGDAVALREQDTRDYVTINAEMSRVRGRLRHAAAQDLHDETARMQALLDDTEAQAAEILDGAEETIESYISAALTEEDLSVFGDVVLPPVDVRLTQPPKILIVSPRDRIERKHDVLLRSDINLSERESIERRLLQGDNFSALVEDIGGLATYPASVSNGHPMRWTLQASAHEWLHHYFFFKPLGRNMFNDDDMFQLNETVANIAGREIGNRAFEKMSADFILTKAVSREPTASGGSDAVNSAPVHKFDFAAEMRRTRIRVDELLEEGRVQEAEEYMEERRRLFVENGYAIRKLNQAYFAFYGTYADLPAAVSPIGDQVKRFRELVPDLGDFISAISEISSYDEFLQKLDELDSARENG